MIRYRSYFYVIFSAMIAIFTAIVLVYLARQWRFPDTRFPLDKSEKVKIGEAGITQTFRSTRNGLSGINILFGGSQMKDGGTISLSLLDESCHATIVTYEKFTTSLETENSFRFSFPFINNSQGKIFCLSIHFSPKKGSKKAAIFVTPNTIPEESLTLFMNGEPRPGESLSFRPVYRNTTLFADLIELNQRISQYKPWFLKGAFLAGIATLSIGLTFCFLMLIIARSGDRQDGKI